MFLFYCTQHCNSVRRTCSIKRLLTYLLTYLYITVQPWHRYGEYRLTQQGSTLSYGGLHLYIQCSHEGMKVALCYLSRSAKCEKSAFSAYLLTKKVLFMKEQRHGCNGNCDRLQCNYIHTC